MTISKVPLLDTRRSTEPLRRELQEAFDRVLSSGCYILGPEVTALEKACAAYVGTAHAVGVSSGTDAILLALMSLGVGVGDEVICPTYTFFASAGTIWRTGAKPVFVDICPSTFNLDPDDVARKITSQTKVIMPVHLFGQCAEMDPILDLAKQRGIAVVEDAAQAIGAEYEGRRAGAMGDCGCFSFFPSKNLGAFGDAGLLTTDDPQLAEQARVLRTHGAKSKYYHGQVGGNFRIDPLQAALVRVKLDHLDTYTAQRQANAKLYTRLFLESGAAQMAADVDAGGTWTDATAAKPILLPPCCQSRHTYNQYVVRVRDRGQRDGLHAALSDRKIGCAIYYPVPMHLQECFSSTGHGPGDFPVSEAAANQTLALPIFPELTEEEIRFVADTVIAFVKQA